LGTLRTGVLDLNRTEIKYTYFSWEGGRIDTSEVRGCANSVNARSWRLKTRGIPTDSYPFNAPATSPSMSRSLVTA